MNIESRKKALRHFFAKVVEPMGFKFTPDTELAEFLLEQEVKLEVKHGVPFCPCQPIRRDLQIALPLRLPPSLMRTAARQFARLRKRVSMRSKPS